MVSLPRIIQGGMGVGVSNWRLAQAVSGAGQLGVVSGTALDQLFARRLQDGDLGGHMRRALDHFPFRKMAERIWNAYHRAGGKASGEPYKTLPMHTKHARRKTYELCIVANFVEVFLARQGHTNPVGINYLEKVQLPHLPSLYGAMLAGVKYVLMGAGIPAKIPDALDRLIHHEPATYPLTVAGAQEGDDVTLRFTPHDFMEHDLQPLERPKFLPVIASNALATALVKKTQGRVDGFVVEGPSAGGHNAPPRGKPEVDAHGDVVYGERDRVDLEKMRALGLPFWLAGGYGQPEKLREAIALGAAGVQMGTAFAFCAESGLRDDFKHALLEKAVAGDVRVSTDALASPTGFPFKVGHLEGTLSEDAVYEQRERICDLGYLREAYRTPAGKIGYRCAAEPVKTYVAKGGDVENTVGRKCVCNALVATAAMPQVRNGQIEPGIVTVGTDLARITRFLRPGTLSYSAADVIATMIAVEA